MSSAGNAVTALAAGGAFPASTTRYFGRAYSLDVYTSLDGSGSPGYTLTSDAWEPEALRMTFEVHQSAIPSSWWFASISLYNLNDPTIADVLQNAHWVTLKAGYQTDTPSHVIWSGAVMQVLYGRENVVDNKVTFQCFAADPVLNSSINFTLGALGTQAQAVRKMVAAVKGYDLVSPLPDVLETRAYPDARTFFGSVSEYFGQISADNGLYWYKSPQGAAIGSLDSDTDTPDYIYSAPLPVDWKGAPPNTTTSYTILGTPVQNAAGVSFRVLLDPRIIVKFPPLLVRIDNTIIQQYALQIGETAAQWPLQDSYCVGEVNHYGDTRGDEWTTEIHGFARAWTMLQDNFLTGQS